MSDPRINYQLLEGEVLKTCPYNPSHAVRPIKFGKHVQNCHRLHVKEQEAKNEGPLFKICPYDRSHHIRMTEWSLHESTCESKKRYNESGWENEEENENATEAGASADVKVKREANMPKVDTKTLKMIQGNEDWGEEMEGPGQTFDAQKRLHNLRLTGYKVINMQEFIGKSKGEKKEIYEAEKSAFDMYEEERELQSVRDASSARSVSTNTVVENVINMDMEYPEEALLPISEDH